MERRMKELEVTMITLQNHFFITRLLSYRLTWCRSRIGTGCQTIRIFIVASIFRIFFVQAQIALLSPKVAIYKNQQRLLQLEQKTLNQQISTLARHKVLRDGEYISSPWLLVMCTFLCLCLPENYLLLVAEIDERKAEMNRLRQLHFNQQQQQQMYAQPRMLNWETGSEQMGHANLNQSRVGEGVYMNSNQGNISSNKQDNYIAGYLKGANFTLDPLISCLQLNLWLIFRVHEYLKIIYGPRRIRILKNFLSKLCSILDNWERDSGKDGFYPI